MSLDLLPHVPLGRLFGLIEAMAATPGPDDVYRLADRLRLGLDDMHPLLRAARLLDWARVEHGDYDVTDEGRRVADADVAGRKALFRARVRGLPILALILDALARNDSVPRETIVDALRSDVPGSEAERQVDTAINWGRWADLFDYDADDACFVTVRSGRP